MRHFPSYQLADDPGLEPIGANRGNILKSGYVRSKNYVTGTTGWNISAAGDAEFNNVTVRGTVASAATGRRYELNATGFVLYSGDAAETFPGVMSVTVTGTAPAEKPHFDLESPDFGHGFVRVGLQSASADNTVASALTMDNGSGGAIGSVTVNCTNLGLYGAPPATQPTITGSRGGNVALANLLSGLANIGAITDSTTP